MTVAAQLYTGQNTNAPTESDLGGGAVCQPSGSLGYANGIIADPYFAQPDCRSKKAVCMSQRYLRSRPEGRLHRDWLRAWILPRLYVGCMVPSGAFLSHHLGIDPSAACKHMRRVLVEAGVTTEVRPIDTGTRTFVTALPERRAAA